VEMAKANLLQAEVAGNRANREYGRLVKLKEVGVVTQQNLDDGLTEKEASAARIEAAKAQLRAAEEDLATPRPGFPRQLSFHQGWRGLIPRGKYWRLVGEMGSQKIMFKIIDTSILDLTVTVPSVEMGSSAWGLPLTFSTDAIPGRTFTGKVMFINPVVNESDRSVKVTAEVQNVSEQLKGGLYVKGRIVTGKRAGILRVPRVALLSWMWLERKEIFSWRRRDCDPENRQTGAVMGTLWKSYQDLHQMNRLSSVVGSTLKTAIG